MIRRALAPLAILLFVALPVTAWATPKVAVTAIDGDSEGEVRDAVAEAIDGDEYKLISKKETNRAVDKLGDISEFSEKDAKKLAKDLSADAIISGSLEKSGAMRTLKVKLFANGKIKKGFSVKFKNASSPKFKEAVRKKVVEKLEGASETASEDEPAKKPKKVAKAETDDEDPNPKAKPKKGEKAEKAEKPEKAEKAEKPEKAEKTAKAGKTGKGEKAEKPEKAEKAEKPEKAEKDDAEAGEKTASGDDEGAKKEPAEDDEGKKPAPKKTAAALEEDEDASISKRGTVRTARRGANRAAARVDVGPSMVKRSLVFTSNLPANLAPRPFRPSPVVGVRVEGDLYPLGLSNPNSLLSALGIAFKLDRTAKMTLNTTAEPDVDIPAEQYQYAVGARIRIVGRSPSSPSVILGLDLGRSRFRADRDDLMNKASLDLPDSYYKFVAPGLAFRIPIGGLLAFVARGEGWVVSDAGQIVRKSSYGRAKVLGFDTEAGLDVVVTKQIAVRLTGGFTQIGYQFTGNGGALANSRDGNANTRDVGGAADRAINAAVTLGVMY